MSRRPIALANVLCVVLLSGLYIEAQSAMPSPLHYQVTVTREAGLNVIHFETTRGPAELYLPDDLVAGEQYSGQIRALMMGGVGNEFVLETAGQQATTREKNFVWRVPAGDATRGITFVLRSLHGPTNDELARVQVPVLSRVPSVRPLLGFATGDFIVPRIGQSGAVFPIVGPFDGDSRHTRFAVRGIDAEVLTESTREALVRLPAGTSGVVSYVLKHDGIERRGSVRSVDLETTYPTATGFMTHGELVTRIKGLTGVTTELGLRIDNRTPMLAEAGSPIFFVNPHDVRPDGTYELKRIITGQVRTSHPIELAVSLLVPRSAEEQISFILELPRRDMSRLPEDEHADTLRPYLPEVLVILADFLSNRRTGWSAYRTMVALDADAAAPLILNALPSMIEQQSGGAALEYYTERVAVSPTLPYRRQVRAAAAQLLEHDTLPWTHGSSCCESRIPAIRALGLLGSEADLPLLERLYQQADLRNAAKASLARLGSASHIANIKATLDAPLPQPFTAVDAYELGEIIRSAGFSARQELIPSVCRHLHTRAFVEGDVILAQPAADALDALQRLVGHVMPPQEAADRCAR
jgi:hypothetical protein